MIASQDRARRADALICFATVLMRVQEFERSLDALREAHDLLEPAVHGWLLALHDWIVAWDLALLGRFDEAEAAARASVERFNAEGEVWLSVDPLNILAGIAESEATSMGRLRPTKPSSSDVALRGNAL